VPIPSPSETSAGPPAGPRARARRVAPRAIGAALLLVLAAGCLAPQPPVTVRARHGIVRAPTQTEADEVAGLLDVTYPRVRAAVPDMRAIDVEVWIQDRLTFVRGLPFPEDYAAFNYRQGARIHLSRRSEDPATDLAHELVHVLHGDDWDVLPAAIEEGLADVVSERVAPARRNPTSLRLMPLLFRLEGVELEIAFDGPPAARTVATLRIDPVEAVDPRDLLADGFTTLPFPPYYFDERDRPAFYSAGYLVVARVAARHGLERLHTLAVRAREEGRRLVPLDGLLDAAGLNREGRRWGEVLAGMLTESELDALLVHSGALVVETLVDVAERASWTGTSDAFLDAAHPTLGAPGGAARLSLATAPGLRVAFRRAWERARGAGPTP